jgi:hypothetical protein
MMAGVAQASFGEPSKHLRGKTSLGTEDLKQHNTETEQIESLLSTFAARMGRHGRP